MLSLYDSAWHNTQRENTKRLAINRKKKWKNILNKMTQNKNKCTSGKLNIKTLKQKKRKKYQKINNNKNNNEDTSNKNNKNN